MCIHIHICISDKLIFKNNYIKLNLIILNTFNAWQECHFRKTPLWGNPNLSNHTGDTVLQKWKQIFKKFKQLISMIHLQTFNNWKIQHSCTYFFFYFPKNPKDTPFEAFLCNRVCTTTRGRTLSIFGIVSDNLSGYYKVSVKGKWEKDKGCFS